MGATASIPLEQRARDEAKYLKQSWSLAPYNFLLQRTQEKYELKANQPRRQRLELDSGMRFPAIEDEVLKSLYKLACEKYMKRCQSEYETHSGFSKTPSEILFASTFNSIITNNPKLKHLEIYPSSQFSKDLPANFKMVVGNYVPDFLVFGLKNQRSAAVAIEIDGDSHIRKWQKDELRSSHFESSKIFSFSIQNDQVLDTAYLTKALLALYRLRNGSLNSQILRAKRGIWIRTVACQLTLSDIEDYVAAQFSIQLNLREEAKALVQLNSCPRAVKKELRKLASLKSRSSSQARQ
jgi:very-short-patch-repair endonuclease